MKEEMIQDSKIVEQIVDDMDLFDDDLMSMVFDRNIPATELLLKIILKQGDITVISVVSQRGFQNPIVGGRDIRLDILAKDSTGRYYNIEVQKKPEGAHVRRARFNSSMMDSRMLKAGQEFSELRDSYMVFITQTDIFGHGLPVYTVNRHFEEIDDSFSRSNKPSSHACMDIWRLPRGLLSASGTCSATTETECRPNTPQLAALEF